MTLEQARGFEGFPLYFPGERVGGLDLEAILRTPIKSPRRHSRITFLYGRCEARSDAGCSSPLRVLVWPECVRFEQRYAIPRDERDVVRGVPARVRRGTSGTPTRVELYPAQATVVVDAITDPENRSALEIARRLRGVNVRLAPSADLPALPPRAERAAGCGRD
jgi:hypothetical protein